MGVHTINLVNGTLTRVGYVDVAVAPEAVGLSAADVAAVAWAAPQWADNQKVRVGAATWFADIGGRRFAFDPLQAADNVLRADRAAEAMHQAAFANVLQQTGFAREADPGAAWKLLREVAGRGRTLIGPLWPSRGFGRWDNGVFVAGE